MISNYIKTQLNRIKHVLTFGTPVSEEKGSQTVRFGVEGDGSDRELEKLENYGFTSKADLEKSKSLCHFKNGVGDSGHSIMTVSMEASKPPIEKNEVAMYRSDKTFIKLHEDGKISLKGGDTSEKEILSDILKALDEVNGRLIYLINLQGVIGGAVDGLSGGVYSAAKVAATTAESLNLEENIPSRTEIKRKVEALYSE